MRERVVIIPNESHLGLRAPGVEKAWDRYERLGLCKRLEHVRVARGNEAFSYIPRPDPATRILHWPEIRRCVQALADRVCEVLTADRGFPLIIGGDCTSSLAGVTGLRKARPNLDPGIIYVDGHTDSYDQRTSRTGEAADMISWLLTTGADGLTDPFPGLSNLVDYEHFVLFGYRDLEKAATEFAHAPEVVSSHPVDIDRVLGASEPADRCSLAREVIDGLQTRGAQKIWLHLDIDVLCDRDMPAVDYRIWPEMPEYGLNLEQLRFYLSRFLASDLVVGMDVTIYSPLLDPNGQHGRKIINLLAGLLGRREVAAV